MSKNKIKTVHEEYHGGRDKSISIVIEYDEKNINKINNSYVLYFSNNIYTIFNTIDDCIGFVTYGSDKIKRGYIDEDDFDELYDNGFNNSFSNYVEWTEGDKNFGK